MTKNSLLLIYCSIFLLATLLIILFAIDFYSPSTYKVKNIDGDEFIAYKDGKIRFQRQGNEKHSIVLLHGFNGSLNNWNNVWPHLSSCASAIRLDIPGFGQSEWKSDDYSLPKQSQRIFQLLDSLNIETATLVGTSMGGSLSAWMAAEQPSRITSLVLAAPSGFPGSLDAGPIGSIVYRPGIVNRAIKTIATSSLYKYLFPDSRITQAVSVTSTYGKAWVDKISQIIQPTIIIWSEGDLRIPFQYSNKIMKLIPQAHLVQASKDAKHNIPGRNPELLADQICELQK